MKKVKLLYDLEALQVMCSILRSPAYHLLSRENEFNASQRCTGVVLDNLRIRMAIKAHIGEPCKSIKLKPEEALALYYVVKTGLLTSTHPHTKILIDEAFQAIQKAYNL